MSYNMKKCFCSCTTLSKRDIKTHSENTFKGNNCLKETLNPFRIEEPSMWTEGFGIKYVSLIMSISYSKGNDSVNYWSFKTQGHLMTNYIKIISWITQITKSLP